MLPEVLEALLTYGPLGVISAVLMKLYIDEKKNSQASIEELNEKIQELLEKHQTDLKELYDLRQGQDKEINDTLKNYGESVIDAVNQLNDLSDRIWKIRK